MAHDHLHLVGDRQLRLALLPRPLVAALEPPRQLPADFLMKSLLKRCQMALEPPRSLPADFLIESLLKINMKWPSSHPGSSEQISL